MASNTSPIGRRQRGQTSRHNSTVVAASTIAPNPSQVRKPCVSVKPHNAAHSGTLPKVLSQRDKISSKCKGCQGRRTTGVGDINKNRQQQPGHS